MNLLINGICGKMGKTVKERAAFFGFNKVFGVDINEIDNQYTYPSFDMVKEKADVIIDFSAPSAIYDLYEFELKNKIPLVICTTGYNEQQKNMIAYLSEIIPVLKCPNTSFGVNILLKTLNQLSPQIKNADIDIIEFHHIAKKDSPSGTALKIAETLKTNERKNVLLNSAGRTQNDICIHSVRSGDIIGDHEIIISLDNETITITHSAHSKRIFADGALRAAKLIIGKPPNLYSMQELV
ncbi:MAG: 4-hydroxy-tetrahydrodipicolinate reductase [Clostridia bacterium]|nr:4-hydroxy-tetrahydrodipicolinate reductase [Clostridia bacterium]